MSALILEVKSLSVSYGSKLAVDNIDFSVQPGEIFGLLGPNGAGKTSALSAIEGLVVPKQGTITVDGVDSRKDSLLVKSKLGVQLQSTSFQPELTIYAIIQLFTTIYGMRFSPGEINEQLKDIGLIDDAKRRFKQLSGGQQQRLSLLIATLHNPVLVILDEPTAGLDPQSRRALWERIEKIRKNGHSILLTTHSMEEAQSVCDRIAIIDRGKIVTSDSPKGLIAKHKNDAAVKKAAHGEVTLEDVFIGLTGTEIPLAMTTKPKITSQLGALLKADFAVQLRRGRSGVLTIITPIILVLAVGNSAAKKGLGNAFTIEIIAASLVVGIMGLCLAGYSVATAQDRAIGIFQRLRVTPTPTWVIMFSRLLIQLIMVLIMTVLVLALAYWRYGSLGLTPEHYLLTIVATIFGGCAFLALGQMIVGLVRSTDAVNSVGRLVYIILTAGGLIGSLGGLGTTVQKIVAWSPYGTTETILQAALNGTAGIDHVWWSLLATVGYAVVFAVIGIRYFTWATE